MKTVQMFKTFSFRVSAQVFVQFKAGQVYDRVTEAAARAIIQAKAGRIIIAEARKE